MFYLAIVNKLLRLCHSWLARQYIGSGNFSSGSEKQIPQTREDVQEQFVERLNEDRMVASSSLKKAIEYGQEKHNHTLQTNPRHSEEEPHNTNKHQKDKQLDFSIKIIAELE